MDVNQILRLLENMTDEELMRLSPLGMTKNRHPHPRQAEFLGLSCEEALYGGAAGGGKTEALLMWLAEGVEVPGYSGVFFRRTYAQLTKSNDSPRSPTSSTNHSAASSKPASTVGRFRRAPRSSSGISSTR